VSHSILILSINLLVQLSKLFLNAGLLSWNQRCTTVLSLQDIVFGQWPFPIAKHHRLSPTPTLYFLGATVCWVSSRPRGPWAVVWPAALIHRRKNASGVFSPGHNYIMILC
jgi:hypothetical protein